MQPTTLTVNNANYGVFKNSNNILYPAAGVESFALRRIFNLAVSASKVIDFTDLNDFWQLDSVWISSPNDSELFIEILDNNNVVFYSDTYLKNTTPRKLPTVLVDNTLTMRVTAKRAAIGLILLYLKPAHLAHSKDF
jgi:hypothetical protein